MKPEEQRIAIAEWCGWSQIEDRSERIMMHQGCVVVGYPPKGALIGKKEPLPDYLNDLNAMHDAEKGILESSKPWSSGCEPMKYHCELLRSCGVELRKELVLSEAKDSSGKPVVLEHSVYTGQELAVIRATAAQRAEALLRTIGRWKSS